MKYIYQLTSQNIKVSATNNEGPIKVEGCFNTLHDAIFYLGVKCGKIAKQYEKIGEVITTIFNENSLDDIDKECNIVYGAVINIKTNKNKTKLDNEEFKFLIYQYPFYENTMTI